MRNNFFCTIIIPVYQVEQYIQKCLLSVVSQSYTKGIECILVNDCTKDESINIAQKLIDEYRGNIKFRIINREENGGLSAARNTGILEAKGDYLYFLDSDDTIEPTCLQQLLHTVMKFPKSEIIFAGAKATAKGFEYLDMADKSIAEYSENQTYIKRNMLQAHYPPTAWNKLIRRDWLVRNHLYFKEGLIYEDDYWTFYAAKLVKSCAVCKCNTYIYNIRPGSITQAPSRKNLESRIFSATDFIEHIDPVCKQQQLSFIYKMLVTDWKIIPQELKDDYKRIFKYLSLNCSFIGKAIILMILVTPICLLRTRIASLVSDKILSKFL